MILKKTIQKKQSFIEKLISEYIELGKHELVEEKIKLQSKIIKYTSRESKLPMMLTIFITIMLGMITIITNVLLKKVDIFNNQINNLKTSGLSINDANKALSTLQEMLSDFSSAMNYEVFSYLSGFIIFVFAVYEIIGIFRSNKRKSCEEKLQCIDAILCNYDIMHESKYDKNKLTSVKENLSKNGTETQQKNNKTSLGWIFMIIGLKSSYKKIKDRK